MRGPPSYGADYGGAEPPGRAPSTRGGWPGSSSSRVHPRASFNGPDSRYGVGAAEPPLYHGQEHEYAHEGGYGPDGYSQGRDEFGTYDGFDGKGARGQGGWDGYSSVPAPARSMAGRSFREGSTRGQSAGSLEQFRQIEHTLRMQRDAKLAADVEQRRREASSVGKLVRYRLSRSYYLFDSKLGKLQYQVLTLAIFGAVVAIALGRLLLELRNQAAEEGLYDYPITYSDGVWLAWGLLMDPGYGLWSDEVQGVKLRSVTVTLVIIGFIFQSTIVGLLVDAVRSKMMRLQEGLSAVVEANHSVVLGWGEQTLTLVKELSNANSSEGGGVIVILADVPKMVMERELATFLTKAELQGTKVVFRKGSRLRVADVRRLDIRHCRSVVIVSNSKLEADLADAECLQVVLNLSTLGLRPGCSVVAEVRDIDNELLIKLVGGSTVSTVSSHDIIGRLMLLFVRQPGLARVYNAVVGFEGSEFYTEHWEALTGVRWRDVAVRFPDAVAIGVIPAAGGGVLINPPPGYTMRAGDALIVLAEDNDSYSCIEPIDVGPRRTFRAAKEKRMTPEGTFFAGWRRDIALVVSLLDRLSPPGSELHIMCSLSVEQRKHEMALNGMDADRLRNLRVVHHIGDPALKRFAETLPLERITSAIVLSDQSGELDVINSDSHGLQALLTLRGLQAKQTQGRGGPVKLTEAEAAANAKSLPVVVEILDPRTQRTVRESHKVNSVADFIQSNELISKMMAMISEDPKVKAILDNLMGASGTQLAIYPAEDYVAPDVEACFLELSREITLTRQETLVGFVLPTVPGSHMLPDLEINPEDKMARRRWRGCSLVVITTNERLSKTSGDTLI